MLKKIFTTTGNFVLNKKHHCFQIRSLPSMIKKQKEKKKKTDKRSVSADTGIFTAVDGIVLRSLKDHYLEASKMSPPPKMNPPAPFEIVKGALENRYPGTTAVLRRAYNDGNESIDVSVMRLANFITEADEEEEEINQLFLHVDVTKKGCNDAAHFLCALYPDAIGIHSVRFGPISLTADNIHDNHSRSFQELDQKLQDAFHMYIEERGINESLFPFLQAWLYVKDHRNLMRWFKSVGSFVNQSN